VFTIAEEGDRPELFLQRAEAEAEAGAGATLRPRAAAPLVLRAAASNLHAFVADIQARLHAWPALQVFPAKSIALTAGWSSGLGSRPRNQRSRVNPMTAATSLGVNSVSLLP
jgi:hypothetical protein